MNLIILNRIIIFLKIIIRFLLFLNHIFAISKVSNPKLSPKEIRNTLTFEHNIPDYINIYIR